jgi:hypothetical protein
MAYNFIPKSSTEIKRNDVAELYRYIVGIYPVMESLGPLALDPQKPNIVKIHRSLETEGLNLTRLPIDISKLTIGFGNGTRQTGGINRGILFENNLEAAFTEYIRDGIDGVGDLNMKKFIIDFNKNIKLTGEMQIIPEGGLNKPRPLTISGNNIRAGSNISLDVGPTVTDLTFVNGDSKKYYLSLKFGGTVTFYNGGVTTILGRSQFFTPNGKIPPNGLAVLNMFGIDIGLFKEIFYAYDKRRKAGTKKIIKTARKTTALKNFARTVVGYGYHLVHKMNNGAIHYEEITRSNYGKYADPISDVEIIYPEPGTAKRIDMKVRTSKMEIKYNIRNKQGGIYPSHIMADYKML